MENVLDLSKKINREIRMKQQKIMDQGYRLRGKGSRTIDSVLNKYDLSNYDVIIDVNAWRVNVYAKGTLEKVDKEREIADELSKKNENFIKRVKSGGVEKSIRKWIEKYYSDTHEVKHSGSYFKSESFYIYERGAEEAILKLSLHNTIYQEIEHGTPFINLNNYVSTIDLKRDLKNILDKKE